MAAYIAVISLLKTLEQLQQRIDPKLIQGQTANTLDYLHATAEYFHNVIEETRKSRFDPEKVKSLEEKIRVAASDAEDVVELKIGQLIKGSSWMFGISHIILQRNLVSVVTKIDTTKKEVMDIISEFSTSTHDVDHKIVELSGDSLICTSRSDPMLPSLVDATVQGLDDDLEIIVKRLIGSLSALDIVTISGMGGIGKTTLARKAYDHLTIRYHFDLHIWVTISQEFRFRNILLHALRYISKHTNFVNANDYYKMKDNELADLVKKNLKGRRYLVVVDDIWSTCDWDSLRGIFPEYNNRSRILLTTRETAVAMYVDSTSPHHMNLLNLENSWKLLRDNVFGPESDHPNELEKIGKEIVEKCKGLPLTILVIAGHLSKMARTLETWKDVVRILGEIVASNPDKCLGVLGLSYHHLPNHLKPCFLSMSCFPEDFQVETKRLIRLWIAEGYIKTSQSNKSLEEVAVDYLEDLIGRNLIMVRKRRFNGEIKACAMHDLLHEFCLIEAETTKFMHINKNYSSLLTQKQNVRRFSFQTQYYSADDCCKILPHVATSIYFSRLDPYATRAKLFGILPIYHPFEHEFFSQFSILRVLAIFHESINFESFPLAITKLFHLRYLQVGFHGDIPASISKLQNLQTLILKNQSCSKTLPGTIWMMKNLSNIHLEGAHFTTSLRIGILNNHLVTEMPNLQEFSALCTTSCTNEVFSSIPNLKSLIVRHHVGDDLVDMSSLRKLEALKCFKGIWPRYLTRFVFPTSLKRLTLAGNFYLPWEDISTLVMLPYLEELKLKDCAVRDKVWRLSDEDKFQSLKLLLFSDIDFQHWEASSDSFPNLKRLVLKNCFHLEDLPIDFAEICTLESIELHCCGFGAVDCARKIEQEQEDMGNNSLKVHIFYPHEK